MDLTGVVALSNRGDSEGASRGHEDPPTMDGADLQRLATAHRHGFVVQHDDAVALNKPYLGSQEILADGARFRALKEQAAAAGLKLAAVQAEFLREFLLGDSAVAELHNPGAVWIKEDPERVNALAEACKRSWDLYRAG